MSLEATIKVVLEADYEVHLYPDGNGEYCITLMAPEFRPNETDAVGNGAVGAPRRRGGGVGAVRVGRLRIFLRPRC